TQCDSTTRPQKRGTASLWEEKMELLRRQFLRLSVGAGAISIACPRAWSQGAETWPVRPIKVISPFSAGAANDTLARIVLDQVATGRPTVRHREPARCRRNGRRRLGCEG